MGEGFETGFWIAALSGTALFLIKTALMLMGGDGHGDTGNLDLHSGGLDLHHADSADSSTAAFNLLSMQSISILAMCGGWAGLAALLSFGFGPWESLAFALGIGLLMVYVLGRLLIGAFRLESSGNLDVRGAVGREGTVYLSIPESGRGQVQIALQGRLVTLDAVSGSGRISTGARVRVEAVDAAGNLVVVGL